MDTTFPRDIWKLILVCNLTQRQMVTAKRTCKLWYSIIKEEVELKMPREMNSTWAMVKSLHIYLQKVPNAFYIGRATSFRYIVMNICQYSDKDIVFKCMTKETATWYLGTVVTAFYSRGHPEWLEEIGIEKLQDHALIGSAEGGHEALFERECNEAIKKNIVAYNDIICIATGRAARNGHVGIIGVAKKFLKKTEIYNHGIWGILYTRNPKLIMEAVEIIGDPIPEILTNLNILSSTNLEFEEGLENCRYFLTLISEEDLKTTIEYPLTMQMIRMWHLIDDRLRELKS